MARKATIVTSGCAPTPIRPSTATTANSAAPAKRRRHSSSPAERADDQDSDNNDGEQDGFVGKAEGLLAEVDQRSGQQVDDQLADGGYWGAGRRDDPCRKPGDSEAGQTGDGSSEPCPPSGGACCVSLIAPVHLPILRRCWSSDNELVLTHPSQQVPSTRDRGENRRHARRAASTTTRAGSKMLTGCSACFRMR